MEPFRIEIKGMTCGHCVGAVKDALAKTPGVSVHKVEVGSAAGEYAPQEAGPEAITSAVKRAGFEATVVEAR